MPVNCRSSLKLYFTSLVSFTEDNHLLEMQIQYTVYTRKGDTADILYIQLNMV